MAAGEWWRIITGFLVHVSGYHLLLDAGAFLMLFESLHPFTRLRQLLMVAACAAGSRTPKTFVLFLSLATLLPPSACHPGVIAGDRTINPILSMMIPGKDDGKVAVGRTKTENMGDFICLHATHACMMRNRKVISQTKYFIKHGCFNRDEYVAKAALDLLE